MLTIKEKIFAYIQEQGECFTFTTVDFLELFTRSQSSKAFASLVKEKKIITTPVRGIYYYPERDRREGKSFFSGSETASGSNVANALARKHGWEISISSDTAEVRSAFTSFDTRDTYYYGTGASKVYTLKDDIKLVLIHVDNMDNFRMQKNHIPSALIPRNLPLSLILKFNIAYDDLVKIAKKNDLYIFGGRWDEIETEVVEKLRELLSKRYLNKS